MTPTANNVFLPEIRANKTLAAAVSPVVTIIAR